jgi:hypothetical protein
MKARQFTDFGDIHEPDRPPTLEGRSEYQSPDTILDFDTISGQGGMAVWGTVEGIGAPNFSIAMERLIGVLIWPCGEPHEIYFTTMR